MNKQTSWGARLLIGLMLIVVGAGAATWGLAHYQSAARFVGVVPAGQPVAPLTPQPVVLNPAPAVQPPVQAPADNARIAALEARLGQVESATERAEGFAGRADALVVAFAARRAIDRGIALGYLEGILRDRFGGIEPQAVATVISASRQPVTIEQLRDQLAALSPKLTSASPDEGWWEGLRRELGGLILVRKATMPSTAPVDRISRAMDNLATGHVDNALAEVARLPAQQAAQGWIANARRYVQARVALDQIETAALLRPTNVRPPMAAE